MAELTQYELSKAFWDYAFANPEKVKPTHIAIYFFAVEHCNRLGWKEKFGLPTSMTIEAIGIKSYNSYKKHFDDLADWGAIKVIEYSKNQYSSNIIALSNALSKNNKALVKATLKHTSKQSESTVQSTSESTGSIDKPITNNLITNNNNGGGDEKKDFLNGQLLQGFENLATLKDKVLKDENFVAPVMQLGIMPDILPKWLDAFHRWLMFSGEHLKQEKEYRFHFRNWIVKIPNYNKGDPDEYQPLKKTLDNTGANGLTAEQNKKIFD